METIRKLPVLLGAGAAILTGTASYASGLSGQECMPRMVVAMAVFFVFGLALRGTLDGIRNDVATRRAAAELEQQREEAERMRQEQEAERDRILGTNVDVRAGEPETAFNPGRVADFIRQELRND